MAFLKSIPGVIEFLINLDYKHLLFSFGFLYYFTTFFWLLRVLIYCGITFINLFNTKHTISLKKSAKRSYLNVALKLFRTTTLKNQYLKLVTITCL